MVDGAMSSVNRALIAELVATPVVGPGFVVAGTVITTLGLVVSGAAAVVNCEIKGLDITRPVAILLAPVMVTVYSVNALRGVPDVKASVAILLDVSIETEPVGLKHGGAQVTLKPVLPDNPLTGSLNAAEIMPVLMATPAALLAGVTAVTLGGLRTGGVTTGGITIGGVMPGATTPALVTPAPSSPKIGSRPPPPHAASRANVHAASYGLILKRTFAVFILLSLD